MEETIIKKRGEALTSRASNGQHKCGHSIRQWQAQIVDNLPLPKSSLQRIDSLASGPYDGYMLKVAARGLCARTAALVGGV